MTKIAEVFSERVDRAIEEVIKVDALDDQIVIDEIREYYPTRSIQEQMLGILEAYADAWRSPTDKVGVWVSGFFGAGKSSFAKLLGILLGSRNVGGQDAIELFSKRVTDNRIKVLLKQIREHQPTHVVIFDILKDNIAGAAQHPVTLVMYRALLRSLGYPTDIDLAELEINLEESGRLEPFQKKYRELYAGRAWDEGKRRTMTAFNEASATLHALDPRTYPAPDSWARTRVRTDISPRKLAERALQLSKARAHGRNVVFVVDEIGQYTARELTRIGDLQGVIESFGQVGRGKIWLIATSQEKLEAILDIYERDRTELARLQDRFGHKVFLNPSDIREVASHRVLAKKAAAEPEIRGLYQRHSGALAHATKVAGAIELPRLEEDAFVQLYPMLPYQVDLLIIVVSGLRQQAGGAQTMGGANRTIIKLAQQLMIHPRVGLAAQPVGRLVTFDGVYELLSNNIATETQQEIDEIERLVPHPFAGRVAKALVLLQFAGAVYPTEENIAAVLHPEVGSPGVLTDVREAVEKLIEARKVRRTEHGLKIQSAAERTWDQERDGYRPTRGDQLRIIKDSLREIWGQGAAQPSHKLAGWKPFTAGLRIGSEVLVDGDVLFDVQLIEPDAAEAELIEQSRAGTQRDLDTVGWTLRVTGEAMRAITERARSERMQTRGARTRDEEVLLREEGRRLQRANDSLREELSKALCRGRMFFQGNDRSPAEGASHPRSEAKRVLSEALDKIFHRFSDGAVQVSHSDAEAILKTESLAGLPACYGELGLVRTEGSQVRLVTDQGAIKEVLDWIRLRCGEGRAPAGKDLEQHFGRAPYGWSIELLQLLVATLLRAGLVTLTSQSQQIKAALTPEARGAITKSNTAFRATTVQVRESALDRSKLIAAAKALDERFGYSCPSLTAESIAGVLREKLGSEAPRLESARDVLRELGLPGQDLMAQALSVLRGIQGTDDEGAVLGFLESVDTLAKAIPRARFIEDRVTEPARAELGRARTAAESVGPVIERELEEAAKPRQALIALRGHLERETFFDHLAEISTTTKEVLEGFEQLYRTAFAQRRQAYEQALEELRHARGWSELTSEEQEQVARPLSERARAPMDSEAWRRAGAVLALIREETRAAPALLAEALAKLRAITTPQAVEIHIRALMNGPISSPEELDAALAAIREAIEKALAEGHPVILI